MEEYKVESSGLIKKNINIKQLFYYNKVHEKHIELYDKSGAENIRDNITSTFRSALEQYEDENKNNNMLLVGKVQSGKTSNLEMFTALALDNGYNMVVIYGGYDNTLLSQTKDRFAKTFDIPDKINYSEKSPVIFSSDESPKLLAVDDEIIEDLLTSEKPIFIISMKRPNAMNKVNALLDRIDKTELKAFIIDDEGDQASLNTEKDKRSDASPTYESICNMKDHLGDPLYLSVTATPQALIFSDEYSRLRPDSIHVIIPGKGYCGAEDYHLYDEDVIEIIDEKDQDDLSNGIFANSLREAIMHYIISSAIMHIRGYAKSEMIVHSHRKISTHDIIYKKVDSYILMLKDMISYNDIESLETEKKEFEEAYIKLFKEEVISQYEFDNVWNIIIKNIIPRVHVILKNSTGQEALEEMRKHKIYIGGDLLQRGVTFSNLVTTYFLRWPKGGGNMDTNLQRARWFGYREKYIDICKIFTTSEISREFTNLSEIETDLWQQFSAIEEGEMQIEDILLKADDTKQNPTRKSVASYNTVSFKKSWIIQRIGIFDVNQVKNNNQLIEELLNNFNFIDTSVGRKDGRKTAEYTWIKKEEIGDLINHIQAVFDMEPFERKPLKDLIESYEEIPVIVMKNVRKRSFNPDYQISYLHQGAGNSDSEKAISQGDKHVIIDDTKINIQIHKILPRKRKDKKELNEYTQYMFAIYVPKDKKYFVRG